MLEWLLGLSLGKGHVNSMSFSSTLGDSLLITDSMLLRPSLGFANCIWGKGERLG